MIGQFLLRLGPQLRRLFLSPLAHLYFEGLGSFSHASLSLSTSSGNLALGVPAQVHKLALRFGPHVRLKLPGRLGHRLLSLVLLLGDLLLGLHMNSGCFLPSLRTNLGCFLPSLRTNLGCFLLSLRTNLSFKRLCRLGHCLLGLGTLHRKLVRSLLPSLSQNFLDLPLSLSQNLGGPTFGSRGRALLDSLGLETGLLDGKLLGFG